MTTYVKQPIIVLMNTRLELELHGPCSKTKSSIHVNDTIVVMNEHGRVSFKTVQRILYYDSENHEFEFITTDGYVYRETDVYQIYALEKIPAEKSF